MQPEIPKEGDNTHWPKEVQLAYASLKIPSLYDCVLANEKINAEIRRQNKEIKATSESLITITKQLHQLLESVKPGEDYEEDEQEEAVFHFVKPAEGLTDLEVDLLMERQNQFDRNAKVALMEAMDALIDLNRVTKQIIQQLIHVIPKKEGFFAHAAPWNKVVEDITQTLLDQVESSRYRLLTRLESFQIFLIEPQRGEPFVSHKHHAVEQLTHGGEPGTIARVMRAGYIQESDVLRLADVVIYT